MCYIDHGHHSAAVVDSVDDAIGAAACAVSIVQRGAESLPNPVGAVEKWSDDELVDGCRDGFREMLGELPARGGGDGQDVA